MLLQENTKEEEFASKVDNLKFLLQEECKELSQSRHQIFKSRKQIKQRFLSFLSYKLGFLADDETIIHAVKAAFREVRDETSGQIPARLILSGVFSHRTRSLLSEYTGLSSRKLSQLVKDLDNSSGYIPLQPL